MNLSKFQQNCGSRLHLHERAFRKKISWGEGEKESTFEYSVPSFPASLDVFFLLINKDVSGIDSIKCEEMERNEKEMWAQGRKMEMTSAA